MSVYSIVVIPALPTPPNAMLGNIEVDGFTTSTLASTAITAVRAILPGGGVGAKTVIATTT